MSLQQTLLGRFSSLESDVPAAGGVADALEVGQVVDEDGAQLDGENLAENDLIEASEEAEVVEEGAEESELLAETAESLESFLSAAQAAKKQGGWTSQEAAAYELGINVVMSRLGGDARDVMPSLESFGSSRERINATASVENRITDTLKKIWEAIKRAVNKVVAFVRKWYLKIADGATRLKKRAEAIRKKAENTTGSAKEKKIRTALSGLHVNKNMPNASELKSHLDKMTEVVKSCTSGKLSKNFSQNCDDVVQAIEAQVEAKSGSTAGLSSLLEVNTPIASHFSDDSTVLAKFPGAADGSTGKSIGELPGGKKLALVIPKSTQDGTAKDINNAARVVMKVALVDASQQKVEIDSSKEVAILEPSQVASLADAVIDLCDSVIDYRKEFENYERKTKDTLSKIDKISGKATKGDSAEENASLEIVRAVANYAGASIRNYGSSTTTVINYGLNLARNVLVYSNSSLNQYKAD